MFLHAAAFTKGMKFREELLGYWREIINGRSTTEAVFDSRLRA
jgi:hypothetical protein